MNPDGILYDTEATNAVFYGGITAYFGAPNKGLVEGLVNENHERRDDFNMMTASTLVITSDSINYTKLYEEVLEPEASTKSTYPATGSAG